MTIQLETCVTEPQVGNGVGTAWQFEFNIPVLAAVTFIKRTIATGEEVVIPSGQFSIPADHLNNDDGGTITYPLSGTPVAATHEIIIARDLAYAQATDFGGTQGGVPASVLETQLDRVVMQAQQNRRDIDRSLKVSFGAEEPTDLVPEEGKLLGWSNGELVNLNIGDASVSLVTGAAGLRVLATASEGDVNADASITAQKFAINILSSNNLKRAGGVGDDATNDRASVASWLASSASYKYLWAPRGTYRSTLTVGQSFTALPQGTTIIGDGPDNTRLKFVLNASDASYFYLFNLMNGGITFKDLTLEVVLSAGNLMLLFDQRGDGHLFDNVDIVGNNQSHLTSVAHAFGMANGNCNDFTWRGGKITGMYWTWLKDNVTTTTQRNWRITDSYFADNFGGGVNLNSPLGSFSEIWIERNTFGNFNNASIGGNDQMAIALAHVKHATVRGNKTVGNPTIYNDWLHFEEGCDALVCTENDFEAFTNTGYAALYINDNNVSGVATTNRAPKIFGNSLRSLNGVSNPSPFDVVRGYGIHEVNDGVGTFATKQALIKDNTIENFIDGIFLGRAGDATQQVQGNYINACVRGIMADRPHSGIKNNVLEACDTGLGSNYGGLWGHHTFVGAFTNYVAVTSGTVGLLGWNRLLSGLGASVAGTFTNIFPAGIGASGPISIHVTKIGTNIGSIVRCNIAWDGTTNNSTNVLKNLNGTLDFDTPAVSESTGSFFVEVFYGSTITDVTMEVSFTGIAHFT